MVLLQSVSPTKMKSSVSCSDVKIPSKPDVTKVTGEIDQDKLSSPAKISLNDKIDQASPSRQNVGIVSSSKQNSSNLENENPSPSRTSVTMVNGIIIPTKPSIIPLTECAKHGKDEDCRCQVVFRVTKGKYISVYKMVFLKKK